MPICSRCKTDKPEGDFARRADRRSGRASHCKGCERLRKKDYNETDRAKELRTGYDAQALVRVKQERRNPRFRAKYVLKDSIASDRKRGFVSDLDIEFVKEVLSLPCSYCGDESLKKTLDRVDNSLGHTTTNVVCSCVRCNFIRRDMPIAAWLVVARSIRACRENGLFGDWIGAIHK